MISSYEVIFCLNLYVFFVDLTFLINIARFVICVNFYYLFFYLGYCKLCFSVPMCTSLWQKKKKFLECFFNSCFRNVICSVHLGHTFTCCTDNLFGGCLIDLEKRIKEQFIHAPYGQQETFSQKKTGYTSIMKMGRKTNEKINESDK